MDRQEDMEDIERRLADLDKWRQVFTCRSAAPGKVATGYLVKVMTDYQKLVHSIPALQPLRERTLGYIQLLQHQLDRVPDRAEKKEEEKDEGSGGNAPAAGVQAPGGTRRSRLPVTPYSVPRTLAVSPSLGGLSVTPDLAVNLRKILFGGTFHVFNYEWRKSFFKFREPYSDLAYALEAERGGTSPIQMVVQAFIIKHLLFRHPDAESCSLQESLREVGDRQQDRALSAALCDILWSAGDQSSATVTLVTADYCITPHLDYKLDTFTERLQLFTFHIKEDVRRFIYEHIQCFKDEGSHGVILFVYSLICSRTVNRLREDLDSSTAHLLQLRMGTFSCRQEMLNLLLTGRATPNVFNGTVLDGEDGSRLDRPLQGVTTRSHVGYLHWSREQLDRNTLPQVGSRLKTPMLPVWLCCINGTYNVLFSTSRSLLSDWKSEHLFNIYYYNGQPSMKSTLKLTIDTHSHHWEAWRGVEASGDAEKRFPSLEMTIRTKWAEAFIHWNGHAPFY